MNRASTVAEGIGWPEELRWHDGLLWFSDVFGRRMVHSLDEAGTIRDKVEGPNCPSGLGWTPDGDLLVVSMNDCLLLRVRSHRHDACGDAACSRRTNPASIRLGYIVDGGICPPNVGSVWVYPVGGV